MSSTEGDKGGSGNQPRRAQIVGSITSFDPAASVHAAVEVLAKVGSPFALIGGLALEAWGIPRATKDADFAVLVGFAEPAAEKLGAQTRPLKIGGVAVRDESRNLRIDFIDRRFHLAELFRQAIEEAAAARRMTMVGELQVPLVSLEHLLAMKLASGEPKDDADVRRILRLQALDYAKARALADEHLGFATANRLDSMARDAGRPELPPRLLYESGDPHRERLTVTRHAFRAANCSRPANPQVPMSNNRRSASRKPTSFSVIVKRLPLPTECRRRSTLAVHREALRLRSRRWDRSGKRALSSGSVDLLGGDESQIQTE